MKTSLRFENLEQRKALRIRLLSKGVSLQEWFQSQVKRELRKGDDQRDL